MMEESAARYIRRRSISAVVLALIFFACCYSANWWEYLGIWSLVFLLSILILLFWLLYQWIFEIALLIRDRRRITMSYFIPISIITIYWLIVMFGFFLMW